MNKKAMGWTTILVSIAIVAVLSLLMPFIMGLDMRIFGPFIIIMILAGKMFNKESETAIFMTITLIYTFCIKILLPMAAYYIFAGVPQLGDLIVAVTGDTFVIIAAIAAINAPMLIGEDKLIMSLVWINSSLIIFLSLAGQNRTVNAFLSPMYYYFNPGMLAIFMSVFIVILYLIGMIRGQ